LSEEKDDSGRIVGKQEVMARIGSAGITSGLPVIGPSDCRKQDLQIRLIVANQAGAPSPWYLV
jgi:hypothetical protein